MPDSRLLRSLTLARGGLDRAAERRGDDAWFDAAWSDPSTRVLVVHRGKAIVVGHGGITAGVAWTDPTYDGSVQGDADGERGSVSLVLVAPQEVVHDGVRVLLSVDGATASIATQERHALMIGQNTSELFAPGHLRSCKQVPEFVCRLVEQRGWTPLYEGMSPILDDYNIPATAPIAP